MDNGSSVDIIYYIVFQQMRINKERLLPSDTPLVGFNGTKVGPSVAQPMGRRATEGPTWEIRVIIGGSTMANASKNERNTYLRMVQSVQIFGRLTKMTRVDNPTISFTKEDT